jgi:hypothetical protein
VPRPRTILAMVKTRGLNKSFAVWGIFTPSSHKKLVAQPKTVKQ